MSLSSAAMGPKDNEKEMRAARDALSHMQTHNLAPVPENYTVWYHYALGENRELGIEVDKIIRNKIKFTQETISYLNNKYINTNSSQKMIDDAAIKSQNVLMEVLKVIHEFSDETKSYNKGVDDYLEKISHKFDDHNVKAIVKDLVTATVSLRERGAGLHQKLEQSTVEIDNLKRNLQQVTIESQRDFLTGVFNRKTFEKYMDEQMLASKEARQELCLLMLDIDHFKNFNDKFGHLLGDEVLKIVARTLIDILKGRDVVARFGGEEFIVILPETPLEGAMKVAENIRAAIASKELKRKDTGDNYGTITVSIGVARWRTEENLPMLLKRADDALYQSKKSGRNRVTKEAE